SQGANFYFEFNHPTSPANSNAEWIPFGGASGSRFVETGLSQIITAYRNSEGTDFSTGSALLTKYKPSIPTALAGLIDWVYAGMQAVPVQAPGSLTRDTSLKFNLMGYVMIPARDASNNYI